MNIDSRGPRVRAPDIMVPAVVPLTGSGWLGNAATRRQMYLPIQRIPARRTR